MCGRVDSVPVTRRAAGHVGATSFGAQSECPPDLPSCGRERCAWQAGNVERSWVRALRSDALAAGEVCAVEVDGPGRLAVWRTEDGQVVVLDDRCPHQWSSLALAGDVDGCELVCTSHGWRFGVDGRASKRSMLGRRDDKGETTIWPVREVDGWVEVQVEVA